MGRRIMSFLLFVCISAGSLAQAFHPVKVSAGSVTEASAGGQAALLGQTGCLVGEMPTGLLPVTEVEVVVDDSATVYGSRDEIPLYEEEVRRSAVYQSEWDRYKNYYVYNQMTDDERAFWDVLDGICMQYLLNPVDAESDSSGGYRTAAAESGVLSADRMKTIARIFKCCNPQYYFLNHYMYWKDQAGEKWVAPGIYSAFYKGTARQRETANVKKQADLWQKEIDLCVSDAEKVKKIHDLIIRKMDYNTSVTNEEQQYSQSAYSVFCKDSTVCAGYTLAFEMMCNGSGVDAMMVTSRDHAWNKVRVNDSWYNVDCTWDDPVSQYTILYTWFERNDAYYDRGSQSSSHQEESMWYAYLPDCTLDTSPPSGGATPGVLPEITDTTAAPIIRVSDGNAVLVSDTAGADIYYTLDGTDPSPASVRCRKYTTPFDAGDAEVRAVAVCDRRWDSRVVSNRKYRITYDGNGASAGSVEAQVFEPGDELSFNKNTFRRKGYVFSGWNTAADGTGAAYEDEARAVLLGGNMILYAQWKPERYTITYHLDGGINGDNPSYFYYDSERITLKDPSREGYTFGGWYLDKGFRDRVVAFASGTIGDRAVYARWMVNGSGAGGNGTPGNDGNDEPGAGGTGGNAGGNDGNGASGTGGTGGNAGEAGGSGASGDEGGNEGTDMPGNQTGGNSLQNPKEIGNASVRLSKTTYYYDGKVKKPAVTVAIGEKRLVSGRDYTLSYQNNKKIGTASVVVTGTGAYKGTVKVKFAIRPKKGSSFTVKGYRYRITGDTQVSFMGIKDEKITKVVIPASVKIGGRAFKVTSVADKALQKKRKIKSVSVGNHVKTIGVAAFSGCTGLTKVTFGTGLTKIGREAFKNCSKLKTITIKSEKLKSVGKNALRGVKRDARIRVPGKKVKAYRKLFKDKGQGSGVSCERL